MKEYYVSIDKAQEIQILYERKQALEDLCLVLSEGKSFIEDNNGIYDKLISDSTLCLGKINKFWSEIENSGKIKADDGQQYHLDFATGKIMVY